MGKSGRNLVLVAMIFAVAMIFIDQTIVALRSRDSASGKAGQPQPVARVVGDAGQPA
jgi:hypothetical protein